MPAMDCACSPQCPARCTPQRECDVRDCPCFQLGMIETDALVEATGHLGWEEIHELAAAAWRDR